jgi:GNAT superfamily N-acetyltransferase
LAIVVDHVSGRPPLSIRDARAAEQRSLTELQRRASLHWDAYREQLLAHPDVVELPLDQIEDGLVRVAELGGEVGGFAVLLRSAQGACELDGLFVEPGHMGAGVGRALVEDAMRIARERGASRIEVARRTPRRSGSMSGSASPAPQRSQRVSGVPDACTCASRRLTPPASPGSAMKRGRAGKVPRTWAISPEREEAG